MSSGAYVALSGLQARTEQLNRLAGDLANAGTSGYKAERSTTEAAERRADAFNNALQSAIDVAEGPTAVDFRAGAVTPTGRDLDLAVDGRGFFVLDTPEGPRYTRNGHFTRRADNVLATEDGHAVLGDDGPVRLPPGSDAITVGEGRQILSGTTPIGRLRVVDFANYEALGREDGARFRAAQGTTPTAAADARIVGGALEQSNVSLVDRMVQLTEVKRSFEGLQRGVSILLTEMDGRAIMDLGRRMM